MEQIRGKNLKSAAYDIGEGYTIVNPIFLKPIEAETLVGLFKALNKAMTEIRSEKFPHGDIAGIRQRNMRLQRLHSATMIIRNYAKTKKIVIY